MILIVHLELYFLSGVSKELALDVVNKVGLTKKKEETADIILKLYDLFLKKDALLIEVNPYAESISTGGCKCSIFVKFSCWKKNNYILV